MTEHIDLDDHATWVAALRQVRGQISELRQKEQAIEEHLKGLLGDHTEARLQGRPVVAYRWTKPVERIDTKRLRRDFPDVATEVTRISPPARRFVLLDTDEGR